MTVLSYNRTAAVTYARRWALSRNGAYYDFEKLGGDCTNFVSQCLFEGVRVMNYQKTYGWYYNSLWDRAPAFTGVDPLFRFLTANRSVGPYGHAISQNEIRPGDIVQFGNRSIGFYHCALITALTPEILVCAHTFDALDRPLSSYDAEQLRFIGIDGARGW